MSEMRKATDAERKALGVPPAYSDVMVSTDPKADLVATARIPNGKTFYRYSKAFVERQAAKKWDRVKKLGAKAEKIERRIKADCASGESRDVAMTSWLIMLTGMRIGNPPQGLDQSYGASSLLMKHVRVTGNEITLDFVGKKGVKQHYVIKDSLIAGYVRERKGAAELFPHNANAVLKYMQSIGAEKVHDLRTWRANEMASVLVAELLKAGMPKSAKAIKAFKRNVATAVAEQLGNNVSQAMKSYIDPRCWQPIE